MALREVLAVFGIRVEDDELKRSTDRMEQWQAKLTSASRVAAGAAAAAFGLLAKSQIETARAAQLNADRLGVSTDAIQEFGYAANAAGRDADDIIDAMSTLQERARDAVLDPKSDPALQLKLLGVAARDANGQLKSAEQLFNEVSDGLQGMGTQTDRVGAAMTLFGDVGRELLPVMQDGAAGLDKLRQEARDTGVVMDQSLIQTNLEADKNIRKFTAGLRGLGNSLASVVMPVLVRLTDVGNRVVRFFHELGRTTTLLETLKFVLMGVAAAAAVLNWRLLLVGAKLIAIAAIIAAFVIVVDDIRALWEGRDSAIGGLIDSFLGVGTAAAGVEDTVRIFKQLGEYIQTAYRFARDLFGILSGSNIVEKIAQMTGVSADLGGEARAGRRGIVRIPPSASNGGGGGVNINTNVQVNSNGGSAQAAAELERTANRINARSLQNAQRALPR